MFPSLPHPQSHHLPSTSNMHHPSRQSKLLDTRAYSQLQSQAPTPSRIRTQLTATKRAHRQSNNNSSTVGSNTPTCANCATQTTPLWRRNQSGETLCNACALFQKMKGRPRPISLKTNVIKPRNRIKAIDRIPLGPSSSHNQQHPLLAARSNSTLVNLTHQQAPQVLVHANEKNQNYPPNSRSIKSPATLTPSLFCLSLCPNPIPPHLCPSALSSPNQFHSATPKDHSLDAHRLSPSPNNSINPSSSQSPSPSRNSFCSTRSTPQVQTHTTQLVRSGVSSRKSSPGGVESLNNQDVFPHEAKRRKYLSGNLLNRTSLYERRISTGSIEPLHQHHHPPLRASSRITHTTPVYPQLCDHRTGPSGKLSDQLPREVPPFNPSPHYHPSVDDHIQTRPPQLVSSLSSGQQTPASIDCDSVVVEEKEQKHLTNASLKCLNRGRSTLKSPGIILPPLSQITKDLVPALQLKPNLINFGPPLSFEASALQARLNSPTSSQNLLTIPSSTHQKFFEKRRAVSVISSASDSESGLSPAHTGSTSSRIHSPLGRSHFPCNTGSPTTPPFNVEGLMCKAHHDSKVLNQYQSDRDKLSYDLGSQPETDHQNTDLPKLQADHPSDVNEPQTQELNRLKDRIVQLELIHGVMEDRISELEHTQPDRASKVTLSETSDDRSSSRSTHDEGRSSFQTIDDDRSPSDHERWTEENWLEDERVERVDHGEEQEDAIDGHV